MKLVGAGDARFAHPRLAALKNAIRFRLLFHVIAHRLLKGLVGQWGKLGEGWGREAESKTPTNEKTPCI